MWENIEFKKESINTDKETQQSSENTQDNKATLN